MKTKYNILIISSIISAIIMIFMTYGVMLWMDYIYMEDPSLKYFTMTRILVLGNVIPAIVIAICTAWYSIKLKKDSFVIRDYVNKLKTLFYLQSGYTFVSTSIIWIIHKAGLNVLLLTAIFIVVISFTFALIFSVISKLMESEH